MMVPEGGIGADGGESSICVCTDRWPLVHVSFVGHVEGDLFEAYLKDLTRAIQTRQGPRALLLDATHCQSVSAAARKQQAAWMQRHGANIRAYTAGVAFVLPSPWLRGALATILWLQPLDCAYAIVKDLHGGLIRCQSWLEPHGLAIP